MLAGRLANLRTAALVAVGFVVLRVVYRVLFGGGSGSGLMLADLPRIPLPGAFSGVVLLGPVTTGGIASAAQSALPFAALILVVGLLAVAVDIRWLLTRGSIRGPLRSASRALVVAWSTFPALRDSVLRVRVARELRGERSVASLIVPVLEQTIERAIALGASMEVRGFAATRHPELDVERPVIMRDVALGFDGTWILEAVDLRLVPGTLTLVTGPTGSGKSTLLDAMSGLFQHQAGGDQDGTVTVGGADRLATPPRETALFIGVVSQAVRLSFVAPTVDEELGFGLAVRDVPAIAVAARTAEIAAELGIEHLRLRPIHELSAGEACLVGIGAALISQPAVLVIDEPLADLDAAARERVVGVLDRLAHQEGVCVVVAEHAVADWVGVADQGLELDDGAVIRVAAPERRVRSAVDVSARPAGDGGLVRVVVAALTVRHGARLAVDTVSLSFGAGERVALTGPNGAGKSSLLHAMARPTDRKVVTVDGVDVRTLGRRTRRHAVALVPEAFDDLLFETTVAAECHRADRLGAGRTVTSGTAATFLGFLGIDDDRLGGRLLDRHPRDLSAGQRMCLVIAIQLSARPTVLLVDEPTRGLDAAARDLVRAALLDAAGRGTTVMVATHDLDFAARFATRTIVMSAGHVIAEPMDAVGPVASERTVTS